MVSYKFAAFVLYCLCCIIISIAFFLIAVGHRDFILMSVTALLFVNTARMYRSEVGL